MGIEKTELRNSSGSEKMTKFYNIMTTNIKAVHKIKAKKKVKINNINS